MTGAKCISDITKGRLQQLFLEGKNKSEIGRILKISEFCVRYNLKKLQNTGSMANQFKGPKRVTTAIEDRRLKLTALRQPFSSSQLLKDMVLGPDSTVSPMTVRRRLHEAKLKGYSAAKKPLLRVNHIAARLRFAKAHKDWTVEQWSRVLWSDESKFNLFASDGRVSVWRRKGQRFAKNNVTTTIKHGGGNIMVWGCFCRSGVGLLRRIEGRMDRFQYLDIIESTMLPSAYYLLGGDFIFQQDNDPKHTSKLVQEWLRDPPGFDKFVTLEWPSQSPDLNPIEHLWEELKRSMRKEKRICTSKADLYNHLERTWNAIPISRLQKLVDSMPARCAAVIKAKGGYTHF